MPLATNPKALFEIILESDKALPENERPVFIYHYLTGLQQIEIDNIMELRKTSTGPEFIQTTFKVAAIGLMAWRNIVDKGGRPVLFDPKKLPEIMGVDEATELTLKVYAKQFPALEDKKKLDGQSESGLEKSAKDAEA